MQTLMVTEFERTQEAQKQVKYRWNLNLVVDIIEMYIYSWCGDLLKRCVPHCIKDIIRLQGEVLDTSF